MRTLENYKKYEAMPRNGEIFMEFIPERFIYRYACDMNYFEQDESGYEYMLRQLKTHLVVNNMPLSYFSNIGTIIRRERLTAGELYADEVFLFVDADSAGEGIERVPAAAYVCLCADSLEREGRRQTPDGLHRDARLLHRGGLHLRGDNRLSRAGHGQAADVLQDARYPCAAEKAAPPWICTNHAHGIY